MDEMPPQVRAVFNAFPDDVGVRLRELRAIVFDVAAGDPRVGAISETLKWGEPAYLTEATGSGSTIRLGAPRGKAGYAAIFVNCKTDLVSRFRQIFDQGFQFEGDRAVLLPVEGHFDREAVSLMLSMAMTYHLDKRSPR